MKSLIWHAHLLAALASLTLFGRALPAFAAEAGGVPAERLERLEQRFREMAERQEQFMREMGAQMERLRAMAPGGPEHMRQPMPPPQGIHPPVPPAGPPPAAKLAKGIGDALGLLFLIGVLCNILMAIWIFSDIRKRGEGSAIFVAMALVAGIPAALIYALTRIGDKKA